MDVYEQITKKLQSQFSIHRWLAADTWPLLKKKITALKPAGVHSLTVAARLDIASFKIYGDPMLDWVLMVYNKIRSVGTLLGQTIQEAFVITVEVGSPRTEDLLLTSENFEIYTWDIDNEEWVRNNTRTTDDQGNYLFDLDNNGTNDLKVTAGQAAIFTNLGTADAQFRVAYNRSAQSDYLTEGEDIIYPSLTDLTTVFASAAVQDTSKKNFYGLKRL